MPYLNFSGRHDWHSSTSSQSSADVVLEKVSQDDLAVRCCVNAHGADTDHAPPQVRLSWEGLHWGQVLWVFTSKGPGGTTYSVNS